MARKITKIVITGGPCAGKTSALCYLREVFTQKGYTVIFVHETATELISGGIAPWTANTNQTFQHLLIKLQIEKEKIFTEGASLLKEGDKILLICDRGTMDNKAYTSKEEFSNILSLIDSTEDELLSAYDAVFHLVTAAKGMKESYTFSNNSARYESAEVAIELDNRLIKAWENHPHHVIIDSAISFEDKLNCLTDEISSFLHIK